MPVYNGKRFIGEAIESVLIQTLHNWELVIVDDGSTDGTGELVSTYRVPQIRYLYQHNQGPSTARNTGIESSRSEYVAFLDADDKWNPDFLKKCLASLTAETRVAGVCTGSGFIDELGNVLPQTNTSLPTGLAFRQAILEGGGFFPIHALLLRKSILSAVGLFDTSLTSVEDWDLWLRISKHYEILTLPEVLAYYRIYPGTNSTDIDRLHSNRLTIIAKNFGQNTGNPVDWPPDKRVAYGFAYQKSAIDYWIDGQSEKSWRYLMQGARVLPSILQRIDTFYEFACGNQQRGWRGQAHLMDVDSNGEMLLLHLTNLFKDADESILPYYSVAMGNANLALGMLSDQAGDWPAARQYMWRAIIVNPRLLHSKLFIRRFVKLFVGQRFVKHIRAALSTCRMCA